MPDLGRTVKYGLGKETVAGTAVAATHWLNQLAFELNPRSEYAENESAFGVIERRNDSTITRQWAEGTFEGKLDATNIGLVLLGVFGSVATADNADTNPVVKDHTFTINQDIRGQSFTLYRKDSLATMRYALARFGQFELSMELDDYVKVTADLMAKKGTSTTATPAYLAPTEFVAKYMNVKTAANEAGLGAASAITGLESFTLTINPNLEADWQSGNIEPYGFSSRGYEIEFEMTCRYNDQVYENAYINGTQLALQVRAINTDVTIGAAANPSLILTAPKMFVTDWSRSEDLDSPISQTMTGTIHYSAADAKALTAVLTNDTASY